MDNIKEKEFREERFEFSLFVDNNLICKRNFKINNYIEGSMTSIDFKHRVDEIVSMIDDDLKSKSRVYTWYNYDENYTDDEFSQPLLEPWECTFKFVITDNKNEVISKIWDGYAYPKAVREKVDITNRTVKIVTKDGRVYTYDKAAFFEANGERLSTENYILKAMIMDKPDLLMVITKKICEICSPREDLYQNLKDYTLTDVYKSRDYELDENNLIKKDENGNSIVKKNTAKSKKYSYSNTISNKRLIAEWGNAVSSKTKEYFKNLF